MGETMSRKLILINNLEFLFSCDKLNITIDKCLNLISNKSNESKLVGLLIIVRLFRLNYLDTITRVYDAIGWEFLDNLFIQSSKNNDGKNFELNEKEYKSLAFSVLHSFVKVPSLVKRPELFNRIPIFIDAINVIVSAIEVNKPSSITESTKNTVSDPLDVLYFIITSTNEQINEFSVVVKIFKTCIMTMDLFLFLSSNKLTNKKKFLGICIRAVQILSITISISLQNIKEMSINYGDKNDILVTCITGLSACFCSNY